MSSIPEKEEARPGVGIPIARPCGRLSYFPSKRRAFPAEVLVTTGPSRLPPQILSSPKLCLPPKG